ncbi:MauE/DoxX family redox-associated membrane protein [Chryseobacterium luquanense]|uniref:MauE/DoxX family redox-associated membrane protein n=1 Tax=Chryseobacterium luquanense TaxID=2983766 RepID=UPI0035CAC3AF
MKNTTIVLWNIIYYVLIIFFSYTVTNKLLAIKSFQTNIFKTGIFNFQQAVYLSYFVLFLELSMVILLIFKKKTGLLFSFIMMLIFTSYIIFLFTNGRYEICGCGGILNGLSFKYHLIINLLITFLSYCCYNNIKTDEK